MKIRKKILFYFNVIFIYFIIITGGTYAYMYISATNNAIASKANCNLVNYKAKEINASNLSVTNNYLEGAKTTITLSYSNECSIYSLANIYVHTNDTTTAPIENNESLKYKVFKGEYQISEGIISTKGDKIVATVPLTIIPTDYDIYLWVDSNSTNREYDNTKYSGYIYATSEQTSTLNGFLIRDLSYNTNNAIAHGADWNIKNGTITTDGVDDYIDCGLENYDFHNSITMVSRVKFVDLTKDFEFFGNWEDAGGGFGYKVSEGLYFQLNINNKYYKIGSPNVNLQINNWYTIIGTYNGNSLKLYVDGNLVSSTNISGNIKTSDAFFSIGCNPVGSKYQNENFTNAIFSDALLYDRALTEKEIKENYSNNIDSNKVDKKDLLFYYNFDNDTSYLTDNLVTNGYLTNADNTNFPNFIYGKDEYGGYLKYTGESRMNLTTNEFILVDNNSSYYIAIDAKSSNSNATYYIGFMSYDIDKKLITKDMNMYIPGSTTTLKQDLKKGDTVVYLDDVSGFKVSSSTPYYQKGVIFWNYTDSTGYTYPAGTYSRNSYLNLYDSDDIDTINNTITLNSAWSGGTYSKGTKLSQSNDGSTYNYILLQKNYVSQNWKTYEGIISGVGEYESNFRYGTKYIRPFVWFNYNSVSDVTFYMKNIVIKKNN